MKIFIKNMAGKAHRHLAEKELHACGIQFKLAAHGEFIIRYSLTSLQKRQLFERLIRHGFELVHNRKYLLVQKIKRTIVALVYILERRPVTNYSHFISDQLEYDYTYLANVFSAITDTTIEQCIIEHKVERVKELILMYKFSLAEIAGKLHYSSVPHLCNQFMKVTGITTGEFKKQKTKRSHSAVPGL